MIEANFHNIGRCSDSKKSKDDLRSYNSCAVELVEFSLICLKS